MKQVRIKCEKTLTVDYLMFNTLHLRHYTRILWTLGVANKKMIQDKFPHENYYAF